MSDFLLAKRIGTGLILALVLAAGLASAGIPQKINYQGRVTDSDTGEPLPGSHDITFRLYDAASGGALLWSEQQSVQADSAGVFSTLLGNTTPVDLSFEDPCWLEIELGGEILLPRRELASVPYAFHSMHAEDADSLGGLSSSSFSLVGHTHDEYVTEGEVSSITAAMIGDGEIADPDIAPDADIDPSKIEGTAWTGENDGSGSGLDADMVDGHHADAFADSGHVHDDRYYTETELNSSGTINQGTNPVDWTRLKNVPGGLADGTDDVGGAGDGHSLDNSTGTVIDVVYVNDDADVGINNLSPVAKLHVMGGFRTGNPGVGWHVDHYGAGTGTRMHWNATKGALRAGSVEGSNYWDDFNVGQHSLAAGFRVRAKGDMSVALGGNTIADGLGAVAIGQDCVASGDRGVAIGRYVRASGANTIAIGASDTSSTIMSNGIANSLMVGFNNKSPILFVGGANRRVGIHKISPEADLDVRGPVKIGEGGPTPGDDTELLIIPNDYTDSSIPLAIDGGGTGYRALTVFGSGNVGVGMDAPLARLHVEYENQFVESGDLQFEDVIVEDLDAVIGLYSGDAGNAGSAVSFAEMKTGVGLIDKWGIIRETTRGTEGGGSGLRFTFGTGKDHFINPLIMYLDDTGKVGIGTDSFGADLFKVDGSACASAWNTCSDQRLKENVEEIGEALDKVLGLRGVRFSWRRDAYEDREFPEGAHYGLVAQEAQKVLPEIVGVAGPDGELSIAYSEIVPLLIESVRELKAENDALKARIGALEAAH